MRSSATESLMTKPILYTEDDEIELPCRWEICSCCRGNGTSSAYLGAITQSDREPGGAWEDPDDFADYMDGKYDRACDECEGSGKVQVVDYDRLTPEQLEAWNEQCRDDREYEAAVRAERRMGC
jgi:hypothetical protein